MTVENSHRNKTFRRGQQYKQFSASRWSVDSTGSSTNITASNFFVTSNVVHNISSFSLTETELNVLNKGLGFCPKEHMNELILKQDIYRFYRHISLKAFFSTKPNGQQHDLLPLSIKILDLRVKSCTTPPTSCSAVKVFINKVDCHIKSFLGDRSKIDHTPNNLTKEELEAVSSLSARRDILIKPVNKGVL